MSGKERKEQIIHQLNDQHVVYTNDLVQQFNVSEVTIRRDFNELEKQGKLKRINGGAIPVADSLLTPDQEVFMQQRFQIHTEEKKKICEKACQEIQDGECIFIDGGTSLMYMIDFLKDKKITIVTHNQLIVPRIIETIAPHLFIIGGSYIQKYAMNVGTETIRQIDHFYFDRCFIGCAGIDLEQDMSFTAEMETKEVKDKAIQNSKKSVLLVDSSKIGIHGSCRLRPLSSFDSVICDSFKGKAPKNFIRIE